MYAETERLEKELNCLIDFLHKLNLITGIRISAEACWSMKAAKRTTADSRRTAVDPRWRGDVVNMVKLAPVLLRGFLQTTAGLAKLPCCQRGKQVWGVAQSHWILVLIYIWEKVTLGWLRLSCSYTPIPEGGELLCETYSEVYGPLSLSMVKRERECLSQGYAGAILILVCTCLNLTIADQLFKISTGILTIYPWWWPPCLRWREFLTSP